MSAWSDVLLLNDVVVATFAVCCCCRYFGVGSFVDTPVSPFGASGEWSYRTDQQLTANSAQVQDVVDNLGIKWGNNFPESQLWALLLVARRLEEVRPSVAGRVYMCTHLFG